MAKLTKKQKAMPTYGTAAEQALQQQGKMAIPDRPKVPDSEKIIQTKDAMGNPAGAIYKGKGVTQIEYEQLNEAKKTGATDVGVGATNLSPNLKSLMQKSNLETAIRLGRVTPDGTIPTTGITKAQTEAAANPLMTKIQEKGKEFAEDYQANLGNVSPEAITTVGTATLMPEEMRTPYMQTWSRVIASVSKIPYIGKFIPKQNPMIAQISDEFSATTISINNDIASVQAGIIPADTVRAKIEEGLVIAEKMHAETKGLGQANVDYWLNMGADTEAKAQAMVSELQNLMRKLDAADQVSRQSQVNEIAMIDRMREQYGVE